MQAEDKTLSERVGWRRFVYDLKHNRHRSRQFVGITFLILLTIVGEPLPALYYWGLVLALPGIAIRLWASGHVRKDKELATNGPYAYVRHPLYVGNHLIMAGFCFASGLWWSFVLWLAIAFFYYPQTIAHEDAKLARLFPGQWEPWAREVRALLPRLRPYRPGQASQWSFGQSLRQNGEPIIAALLLLLLLILYQRLPPAG